MKKILTTLTLILAIILIPVTADALTVEEVAEKGELTLKSVPLKNQDEVYQINEYLYEKYNFSLINCNSTYTTCSLFNGIDDENLLATDINIKYEYDETVKNIVDKILEKIPEGGKSFYIEDIYTIKYILDSTKLDEVDENNEGLNPIKYSPEFNSFIGYNNFFFEPRQGDDTMYAHFAEGPAQFKYDDVIYGYGHFATRVNSVIYVNDDETDIEGAIKTRLSKYFNIDKVVKDNETTIDDLVNMALDEFRQNYNDCVAYNQILQELAELEAVPENDRDEQWYLDHQAKENERFNFGYYGPTDLADNYESADEYALDMLPFLTDADSIDALWNFKDKVLPNVYVIYFTDDLISSGIPVFVIKDSSKVVTDDLSVITRDTKSGITISNIGTSKSLPFDTLIKVSKLTKGTDFDKVMNALNTLINEKNAEVFDLQLFANSIEDNIRKLDDGSFEVRIPLSDNLKNEKSLVVYFVDNNNKVEEHEVSFKTIDGVKYAVFTTDHFSVYTLAPAKINNPETNDNIAIYVSLMLISSLGFGLIVNRIRKTN